MSLKSELLKVVILNISVLVDFAAPVVTVATASAV